MITNFSRHAGNLVELIALGGYKKATKYISPRYVMKATRRHKLDRRDRQQEMVVTVGGPNYLERKFIKRLEAAGEPFPVRKVQLR